MLHVHFQKTHEDFPTECVKFPSGYTGSTRKCDDWTHWQIWKKVCTVGPFTKVKKEETNMLFLSKSVFMHLFLYFLPIYL